MERFRALSVGCLVVCLLTALSGWVSADVLLQSDSRERFGEKDFAYFFIEAEDYHDNDPRFAGASWLLSSDPLALLTTVNELQIDPVTGNPIEDNPGAYASGEESITNAVFESLVNNDVGGGHDIQYQVEFDTPGVYYLYIRHHSPLGPEFDRNKNDSFYYPVDFGEDPRQLKANGDDYGILESIAFPGDTTTRGPWVWFAARVSVENSEQDPPINQNPAQFNEYVITEDMVQTPLILEFDHREDGCMLDAFLFIETSSGLPPTNGEGPDGLGFYGQEDPVDMEFDLKNLGEPCEAPEIFSVSPEEGPAGSEITITGTNLACAAGVEVLICDVAAETREITETSITAVVPACVESGAVDVTVSHVGFESDTLVDGFAYGAGGVRFKRGDCDGNGQLQGITDAIALLGYNFLGGVEPPCLSACDVNQDANLGGVTDGVHLLMSAFMGGKPPEPPYPDCGPGAAIDKTLGCQTPPAVCMQ